MRIEERIFENTIIDIDALKRYGFKKDGDFLVFKKPLIDNLEIVVKYKEKIEVNLYDNDLNEEYLSFRYKDAGTYANTVSYETEKVLLDIKENATKELSYKFPQTIRIDEYMSSVYGMCEHPFGEYPGYGAYKESGNDKWYALIMSVARNKVDKNSQSDELIEVINLKVGKKEIGDRLKSKGIFPAYHMNKQNWVSIILDDTLNDVDIIMMINDSYDLVLKTIQEKKFFRRKY